MYQPDKIIQGDLPETLGRGEIDGEVQYARVEGIILYWGQKSIYDKKLNMFEHPTVLFLKDIATKKIVSVFPEDCQFIE